MMKTRTATILAAAAFAITVPADAQQYTPAKGTTSSTWQVGVNAGGANAVTVSDNAGTVELKNAGNTAFAVARAAPPVGADDVSTKNYTDAHLGGYTLPSPVTGQCYGWNGSAVVMVACTPVATPTGTGFTHVTAGVQDPAARGVNLSTADVTGTLAPSLVMAGSPGQFLGVTAGPVASWMTLSGDCTIGDTGIVSCTAINGSSVTSGGFLTTGNVLQVVGSSALSYEPIQLAGGANYVSGLLPSANQAMQSLGGDLSGTTGSATVVGISGSSPIAIVPATLQWDATTTTPSLTQASTSNVAPQILNITPQASTNANGNGGTVEITIPTTTGTGTYGTFMVQTSAGVPMLSLDQNFLSTGSNNIGLRIGGQQVLGNDGADLMLGITMGSTYFGGGDTANHLINSAGLMIGSGFAPPDFGTGSPTNVIGLATGTLATSLPASNAIGMQADPGNGYEFLNAAGLEFPSYVTTATISAPDVLTVKAGTSITLGAGGSVALDAVPTASAASILIGGTTTGSIDVGSAAAGDITISTGGTMTGAVKSGTITATSDVVATPIGTVSAQTMVDHRWRIACSTTSATAANCGSAITIANNTMTVFHVSIAYKDKTSLSSTAAGWATWDCGQVNVAGTASQLNDGVSCLVDNAGQVGTSFTTGAPALSITDSGATVVFRVSGVALSTDEVDWQLDVTASAN